MPVSYTHLDVYKRQGQNGVEFICSGYLDTTAKGFPELNMSWDDESFHYFLISEKGYERLGMLKQIFNTSVDAKKGKETAAAEKLAELVQNENNGQEDYNIYYLSDVYKRQEKTMAKPIMRIPPREFSVSLKVFFVP